MCVRFFQSSISANTNRIASWESIVNEARKRARMAVYRWINACLIELCVCAAQRALCLLDGKSTPSTDGGNAKCSRLTCDGMIDAAGKWTDVCVTREDTPSNFNHVFLSFRKLYRVHLNCLVIHYQRDMWNKTLKIVYINRCTEIV